MTTLSAGEDRRHPHGLPLADSGEDALAAGEVRVLIVEDEWLVSLDIEAALRDAGYDVVGIAASADEAVDIAARLKPHVATMDIRLNGAPDGIDAARELYRRFGIRCLFVSAYSDGEARKRAADAKPLGWIQKPIFAPQIAAALREALRDSDRE